MAITKSAATAKPVAAGKGSKTQAAAIVATMQPAAPASAHVAAPSAAPYTVPTAAQWQAAPSGTQQAALCHACFGNTMPPAHVALAAGTVAPRGKQGGTRQQHGSYLQAACNNLGSAATVGSVLNAARQLAKSQGWQGWASINQGALRCALQQGVLVAK